jgi:subtilisin family serine protease
MRVRQDSKIKVNKAGALAGWPFLAALFFLVAAVSSAQDREPYARSEVLIRLSPQVQDAPAWLVSQRLSVTRRIAGSNAKTPSNRGDLYRVSLLAKESVYDAIARLKKRSEVAWVQPNYHYRLLETTPNDPFLAVQWHLDNPPSGPDIHATGAWDITTGSDTVLVAVIDTGIDYNHPDLAANLWTNPEETPGDHLDNDGNGYIDDWRGWDFADRDYDPKDDHSHGTHVAGILGAIGNNAVGVAGVCGKVRILPLDAFDFEDSLSSDLIEAIRYAKNMGARIVNASWGDQYEDLLMQEAIREFTAAGGLFVTAAGNDYGENNDYFSSLPPNFDVDALLSVGASDIDDDIAGFSSIGPNRVHLMAPGDNIYSTYPTYLNHVSTPYAFKDGTSMASPVVAGVAALIWSWNPNLSNLEVKYRIMGGVDRSSVFADKCLSGGRLNAAGVFMLDGTPPAAVSDLVIVGREFDRLNFRFTTTGDDGLSGTARFYDIRYSTAPIDEANWESAKRGYDAPQAMPAGAAVDYALLRLDEATNYYIRMIVIDEVGNLSSLSNQVTAKTTSPRIVFSDDLESGIGSWEVPTGSTWTLSNVKSHSGQYCWTESPAGDYARGDQYLISPPIDLRGTRLPLLRFWHRYDIEPMLTRIPDYAEIRASTDGLNWSEPLAKYWDAADWWILETLDLSAFKEYPQVRIRFHFHADYFNNYDGWYLDDIRVLDAGEAGKYSGWLVY